MAPSRRRCSQQLLLCLLAIWAFVAAEARDVRPSEHGLLHQKDPGPVSPAMVAFFRGRPEVALPEARNVSDLAWKRAPPGPERQERARSSALLAAGLLCGVVGSALLAVAALAYAVHARRSGPGWSFDWARKRSGPEVRLGSA
ncbi:hypothetical protein Cni_G20996 [Canna indica]|uniref:Uncharacterized protein n=1 Tax=Canna indica TaxID=4628 RepID=A0AAQ3KQ39_9LILI|nr:hypothetical protein Cni_G20996 [Canna indica]